MSASAWDLVQVVRLERQLLDPVSRADAAFVERVLHPDFVEHGASGRVWTRTEVIAALRTDRAVGGEAREFVPVALADNVVLLTYRIAGASRPSLRSSIWVRAATDQPWRLRFHQGTAVPADGVDSA